LTRKITEDKFPATARARCPDLNALDHANNNIPLSDFFSLTNQRSFTPITTPFPPSKFETYYSTPQNGVVPVPTGPDGTSGEEVE
jgi:hypothetical protein